MSPPQIKYRCCDWGNAEMMALLSGLVRSSAIARLQAHLEQQYQVPLYLINSARAGLKIALEQCRIRQPGRNVVIVPSYICNSVPQTITQIGLKPVSAPVNAHLNLCTQQLGPMLDESCLAVVMPHMYGVPADVITIRQLTRDKGIFLIDDSAQVAGIKVDGQLLGTFGDYGLLSFAQAKSIVTGVRGSGGVLFNTSGTTLELSLSPVSRFSRLPKYWHFYAHYNARGLWKAADYYAERMLDRFLNNRRDYFPSGKGISEPDAAIALRQFNSLSARIHRAIELAEIVRKRISACPEIVVPQFSDSPRYVSRFVIQSRKLTPVTLAEELRRAGIETRFCYGDSSRAFDGSNDSGLLELPWIGLKESEVNYIIDCLNKA